MAKTKYTRVCTKCGNIATVSYRPKGHEMCRVCSRIDVTPKIIASRKANFVPKRYIYFCPHCDSIRYLVSRRKSPECGVCSRKYSKSPRVKGFYDLGVMEMRYFRICPHCPENDNTKLVKQASLAGIRPCAKHRYIGKEEELAKREAKRIASLKKTVKAKPKKKASYVSKKRIEELRELNRKHKEAEEANKKIAVVPQVKTDEEMMAEWLSKNKVTVVEANKTSKHLEGSNG